MTYQQKLLLAECKKKGYVNSYDATYIMGIKQAPARIQGMEVLGFVFNPKHPLWPRPKQSVDWWLIKEPEIKEEPKKEKRWIFEDGIAREPKAPEQQSFI